jgi:hypothetical protein
MHVQRPIAVGPGAGAQASSGIENSQGGDGRGGGDGLRADWQIRMNVLHSRGFIGGAGRLLVHNEVVEDLSEILLFLPMGGGSAAPGVTGQGNLNMLSAVVCSAKPGIPATAGQSLPFTQHGRMAKVTIPLLRLNDWLYIDLQWDGSFPENGGGWPAGAIPMGAFHPQVSVDKSDKGQKRLYPIPARYDVTVGTDPSATIRMEMEGGFTTRQTETPGIVEHHFNSYGNSKIMASVLAPGSVGTQAPVATPGNIEV